MIAKIPLKKKIALEIFRKYRNNEKKLHTLNYIFWECTLRCNLNCRHCGSDCKKEASVKDMPVKDFINAIDEIIDIVDPNNTTIVFTGGEPLLRKDLEICGKELKKRGFPWGTVTNGYSLTPARLQSLLDAGLRAVTVSIDGLENSHNWLRGNPKSFGKALEAVELLEKERDLVWDVVTCVNRHNFIELPELKKLLMRKGVKKWRLFTIFSIGRASRDQDLQLPPKQFKQLFDFIKSERQNGELKISYGCEGFLGSYEGDVRDNLFFCRAGINVGSILIDGSVSACPNLRTNFIQGNIYKDNFREIWETRYQKLRNREWAKTGECADCRFFKYCEGNGLHLRGENNGELLFCHLKRIEEGEKKEESFNED